MSYAVFAHNGIDHVTHAHKSAEHASQPNIILWVAVALLVVALTTLVISRLAKKPQAEHTITKQDS